VPEPYGLVSFFLILATFILVVLLFAGVGA